MSAVEIYRHFGPVAEAAPRSETFTWANFSIEILATPTRLEADWHMLEQDGVSSLFQSWQYVSDWLRMASHAAGEMPVFVAARRNGKIAFILPLALRRLGGIHVLSWLGQSHANYGMGLFQRDVLEEQNSLSFDVLIQDIARETGAHLVHLDMQPETWMGFDNPFAKGSASLVTANDTYIVTLEDDFDAQYKRLFSPVSLSKMRRKWRRILDRGTAVFQYPDTDEERAAALDWFIETKGDQLAESGRPNPFEPASIRDFYLAQARRHDSFFIDQLVVNDTREAVGFAATCGNVGYYLNTVHSRSELAKYSPGSHLTHQLIARMHRLGVRVFDLGPGEVPYKFEWEPKVIQLKAATYLVAPVAAAHYAALRAGVTAKSLLKRNPQTSSVARRVMELTRRARP